MGNAGWRGVAEPFVNLAASLLGFDVIESLAAVAEGPGELLQDARIMERLEASGLALGSTSGAGPLALAYGPSKDMAPRPCAFRAASLGAEAGESPEGVGFQLKGLAGEAPPTAMHLSGAEGPARCPTCRSDFFRLEAGMAVCPVCGAHGNLAAYTTEGKFVRIDSEERWGRAWLRRHVASWIKPSVERYKSRRERALKDLRELRRLYSLKEGEGPKP
jgi:uncharacterized Zn finger protein (UPF0148 family)